MTTILGTPSYTHIEPNFVALASDRLTIVGCHNLSSARAYATGRVPELRPFKAVPTLPAKAAFRSPSGQYYVTVELRTPQSNGTSTTSTVRIDCANQATARYYWRNGVSTSLVASTLISEAS